MHWMRVHLVVKNGSVTRLDGRVIEPDKAYLIPGFWFKVSWSDDKLIAELVHGGLQHVVYSLDITREGVYFLAPHEGRRLGSAG